jgi:hypothetical protein
LTQSSTPNLFFNPDSQFNESKSTYLDFVGYSIADWESLGQPNVIVNTDTSGIFTYTELVWDIMSIDSMLTDTVDSNLIRNFAIQLINSDTNFIELFSREATSGDGPMDPKVKMYYRQNIEINEDSTFHDTSNVTIYSFGDISIIDPGSIVTDNNGLSNGIGLRSKVSISFNSASIPEGSLIRKALFSLPIDTSGSSDGYNIIVDPIDETVDTADVVFETDPYPGIGYPYRISSNIENGMFIISLKSFLQNITLGNETNLGFKVVSNEKNDPFESINFDIENESAKPILEIIYVAN